MTRTDELHAAEQRYRQALADYTSLLIELGRDKEAADLNVDASATRLIRGSAEADEIERKAAQG
jgi:hypothetical protein